MFKKLQQTLNLSLGMLVLTALLSPVYAQNDQTDLEDFTIDLNDVGGLSDQGAGVDVNVEQIENLQPVPQSPSDDLLSGLEDGALLTDGDIPLSPLVPYSGQYFDANSVSSSSSLRQSSVPRQVDPKYVPGSRYVIVRKDAESNSYSAKLTAARRANDLGRFPAALELYEQLYKENPKSKQVLLGLAIAQQNNGFVQSAIGTYEELLNIDPDNTSAEVNMLGLIMERYPAIAFRKLVTLWEKNSNDPAVAAQVGLTSAKLGNTKDAMRYLGIAASLEPNNANHYYNLAIVTDRAGAYKDAIDFYQKALEIDTIHGSGRSVPRSTIYDRLAKLRRL